MGSLIGVAVPVITVVLMATVGSVLRTDDFRRLRDLRGVVTCGLVLPPVLLPALAFGTIALWRPSPATAVGLLLVAACPVGGVSSAFTYLAGGTAALSITLTTLSCVLAVATIPAVDLVYGRLLAQSLGLKVPRATLLAQLVATVLIPVVTGMLLRAHRPLVAERLGPAFRRLAFGLLGALLLLTIAADVPAFLAELPVGVPLAATFVIGSLVVGLVTSQLSGGRAGVRAAVTISFATRNVGVATMIAVNVLGRVDYARFATTYFLTELPLMVLAAAVMRSVAKRPELRQAQ